MPDGGEKTCLIIVMEGRTVATLEGRGPRLRFSRGFMRKCVSLRGSGAESVVSAVHTVPSVCQAMLRVEFMRRQDAGRVTGTLSLGRAAMSIQVRQNQTLLVEGLERRKCVG